MLQNPLPLKLIKYVFIVLVGTLFLNAISWYYVGKERALELSLNYFEYRGPMPHIDTLFVFSTYTLKTSDGRIVELDNISHFSESTRSSFLEKLKVESQVQNLIFKDSSTNLFSDYQPGSLNFSVDVEYTYPFYVNFFSGVSVYGFGA